MEQPPLDQPETLAESSETSEQVDVTQSEEIAAAKKTARPRKSATRKVADELSELPVRMTFDLGEYPLTLRELNAVQVGHVFDLALAPQQAVNLRVNGRLLGEGELVEIDGRIGIAVTRFLAPRS